MQAESARNDGVLASFPDPAATNPALYVELKETLQLLFSVVNTVASKIQECGGKKAGRRMFTLCYLSLPRAERPPRSDLAETFSVSIQTVDKDLSLVRGMLSASCREHSLPEKAFENFINAL